jgi:hypothetical protein
MVWGFSLSYFGATEDTESTEVLATKTTKVTKGLHRRRLKNALQVRAESVLDTNPSVELRTGYLRSAFRLCSSAGCYQPAVKL